MRGSRAPAIRSRLSPWFKTACLPSRTMASRAPEALQAPVRVLASRVRPARGDRHAFVRTRARCMTACIASMRLPGHAFRMSAGTGASMEAMT